MKHIQKLLLPGIAAIAIISCRSTKSIQTAIAKKDTTQIPVAPVVDTKADSIKFIQRVMDTVQKNRIDFNTFKAKIKVVFEGRDGKRNDFNAFIQLKKDSVLWVSVNALLGIEAFRAVITPDSVKMLDKIERVAKLRSVEYLQEVTRLPMTFTELQDLIVGNPVFLDSNNINSYKKDERTVSLISLGQFFKHLLTVNKDGYTLQHSKLDDVGASQARTADITYGDYEFKNGRRFSTYRKITVSEKAKLDIEMQFKQIDFNVDLNFSFNIPRNYTRE